MRDLGSISDIRDDPGETIRRYAGETPGVWPYILKSSNQFAEECVASTPPQRLVDTAKSLYIKQNKRELTARLV